MANDTTAGADLRAEIVSIGTELLLGEIVDTNAAYIAGRLPALGIPLYRIQQVGDNRERLTATLRTAWERAPLLILTGGLGPTEDDVTREAIADLLGETMAVVPSLETELRAFFAGRNRAMPERNVKQATLIPSAVVLANPIGTAPGWWVARDGRYIATMPGVPTEMRRMWTHEVTPHLLTLPRGHAIVSRTLKILGIGESMVEEGLGELVRGTNPTVATYAKSDGIHVRLAARAPTDAEARAIIYPVEERVRALFGGAVYGVDGDGLGEATARLLLRQGVRPAVAEAGTDGAICHALGSAALAGALVLPSATDPHADPREQVVALARRAQDTFGVPIGLGVLVSPVGPDRQMVAAALRAPGTDVVRVEEHRTDDRDAPRRAMLLAVDLLRGTLLADEAAGTGEEGRG